MQRASSGHDVIKQKRSDPQPLVAMHPAELMRIVRALGQASATQLPKHVGLLPQLAAQSSVSRQFRVPQTPQSAGHEKHVSKPVHAPSPQPPGHGPQSLGQLEQVSRGLQKPSPQTSHGPQSDGQLAQSSSGAQKPSPQVGHVPQSAGHVEQVSPSTGEHRPSPQAGGGHGPQSG